MTYTIGAALPAEVEAAEETLAAYYREHYGSLWGDTNEAECARLTSELETLYETHNVPAADRQMA